MGNTSAFRVMLRMKIYPGRERDFEQTWLSIGEAILANPANLSQWLTRSTDEDGVYFIISDWVDEATFREFERSPGHLEHRQKLHPLRESGSMSIGTVVNYLGGKADT